MSKTDVPRWRTRGWRTAAEARGFFYAVAQYLSDQGFRPGMAVPEKYRGILAWLLEGQLGGEQAAYFTLCSPTRRADRQRSPLDFAFVDQNSKEHRISVSRALRGKYRAAETQDDVFSGLST